MWLWELLEVESGEPHLPWSSSRLELTKSVVISCPKWIVILPSTPSWWWIMLLSIKDQELLGSVATPGSDLSYSSLLPGIQSNWSVFFSSEESPPPNPSSSQCLRSQLGHSRDNPKCFFRLFVPRALPSRWLQRPTCRPPHTNYLICVRDRKWWNNLNT